MKLDSSGRLAPGRHNCTIDELHHIFVAQAPHNNERTVIIEAFMGWRVAIKKLIPNHTLWVDGSFTMYNSTPPNDIDVVIMAKSSEVNSLAPSQKAELTGLLTSSDPSNGDKVQPMGGLVDAFISFRDRPDDTKYWYDLWQKVKGEPNAIKGFLVVKAK